MQTAICTQISNQGQSKCQWGQNEWCASLSNAKRCKACDYFIIFKKNFHLYLFFFFSNDLNLQKLKHCMRLSWFIKRHPKPTPSNPSPATSITLSSTNTIVKSILSKNRKSFFQFSLQHVNIKNCVIQILAKWVKIIGVSVQQLQNNVKRLVQLN